MFPQVVSTTQSQNVRSTDHTAKQWRTLLDVAIQIPRVARARRYAGVSLLWGLAGSCFLLNPTATRAAATPDPPPAVGTASGSPEPPEVLVEANEPKYVAPTLRDRIGRIWAPVLINGKGPFRLVLDTGASHSAIIGRVADSLGLKNQADNIVVRGVTGSAVVPALHVDRMEVGAVLIEPSTLPIVADVFGGAEGVLGREGMPDKRIYADFTKDLLTISRSHREHAPRGFNVVPLKLMKGGLLTTEVRIGSIRTHAIIDTGGQQSVGNIALLEALKKYPPKNSVAEDIIGVTLDMTPGNTVSTPPMDLGTLKLRGVRITFADMYLFDHLNLSKEPTVFLGMDVLGSFEVLIIDYRMHEMQIKPRGP
jgi:aspartyl protease